MRILDSDVGRDDLLASGITESNGGFSIEWKARKTDWRDNTAEVYAKFEGSDNHDQSKSRQYVITIAKARAKGKG